MLFLAFVKWWYMAGWAGTFSRSEHLIKGLARSFSIVILLRTLFAPWKQMDAFGGVNQGLDAKFRHAVDKFVSRFVGFFVRFFTIFAALVSLVALSVIRAVWTVLWPLVPLIFVILLLYAAGLVSL